MRADIVSGAVTRKIKGGLLVNIGVNVFLPASQVDIRRPHDIGEYIGKEVRCKILKIDQTRRNIVVSRRKLIEDEREEKKKKLLAEIDEGAEVGDVFDDALAELTNLQLFEKLGLLLGAFVFDQAAAADDDVAPRFVDLEH